MLVSQNLLKNNYFSAAILHPFYVKVFKSETTSFHPFSPKDFENLNSLDIRRYEVGAKRHLKGVKK